MEECSFNNHACIVLGDENPSVLLIQPVDQSDLEVLEEEYSLIKKELSIPFLLVAYKIEDWNHDLTPWKAPAVFGKQDFGSGAQETLDAIIEIVTSEIEGKYRINDIPKIIGGYSLAGLFALWVSYQTDVFEGVVAASPSVWYPQWLDYAKQHQFYAKHIYLSLGDKEEKTKNPTMATVGDCIRTLYSHLEKETNCILEWNEGNHFKDSEKRCAKGFVWCMRQIAEGGIHNDTRKQ